MGPVRVQESKKDEKKKGKGWWANLLSLFGRGASAAGGTGASAIGTATITTTSAAGGAGLMGFLASKMGIATLLVGGGLTLTGVAVFAPGFLGGPPSSTGTKDQGFATHARAVRNVDDDEAPSHLQTFSEGARFAAEGEGGPAGDKKGASDSGSKPDTASAPSSYSEPSAPTDAYGNKLSSTKASFGDTSFGGGGGGGTGGGGGGGSNSGASAPGLQGREGKTNQGSSGGGLSAMKQDARAAVGGKRIAMGRGAKGARGQMRAAAATSLQARNSGNYQASGALAGKAFQGGSTGGGSKVTIGGGAGTGGAGMGQGSLAPPINPNTIEKDIVPPKPLAEPKPKPEHDSCSKKNVEEMKTVMSPDDWKRLDQKCKDKKELEKMGMWVLGLGVALMVLQGIGATAWGTGTPANWPARILAYAMFTAITVKLSLILADAFKIANRSPDLKGMATAVGTGAALGIAAAGKALFGMFRDDWKSGRIQSIFKSKADAMKMGPDGKPLDNSRGAKYIRAQEEAKERIKLSNKVETVVDKNNPNHEMEARRDHRGRIVEVREKGSSEWKPVSPEQRGNFKPQTGTVREPVVDAKGNPIKDASGQPVTRPVNGKVSAVIDNSDPKNQGVVREGLYNKEGKLIGVRSADGKSFEYIRDSKGYVQNPNGIQVDEANHRVALRNLEGNIHGVKTTDGKIEYYSYDDKTHVRTDGADIKAFRESTNPERTRLENMHATKDWRDSMKSGNAYAKSYDEGFAKSDAMKVPAKTTLDDPSNGSGTFAKAKADTANLDAAAKAKYNADVTGKPVEVRGSVEGVRNTDAYNRATDRFQQLKADGTLPKDAKFSEFVKSDPETRAAFDADAKKGGWTLDKQAQADSARAEQFGDNTRIGHLDKNTPGFGAGEQPVTPTQETSRVTISQADIRDSMYGKTGLNPYRFDQAGHTFGTEKTASFGRPTHFTEASNPTTPVTGHSKLDLDLGKPQNPPQITDPNSPASVTHPDTTPQTEPKPSVTPEAKPSWGERLNKNLNLGEKIDQGLENKVVGNAQELVGGHHDAASNATSAGSAGQTGQGPQAPPGIEQQQADKVARAAAKTGGKIGDLAKGLGKEFGVDVPKPPDTGVPAPPAPGGTPGAAPPEGPKTEAPASVDELMKNLFS